jgi:hypothetical protein
VLPSRQLQEIYRDASLLEKETVMSVKEKLLLLAVVAAMAVSLIGHHYWACAIAILQHILV